MESCASVSQQWMNVSQTDTHTWNDNPQATPPPSTASPDHLSSKTHLEGQVREVPLQRPHPVVPQRRDAAVLRGAYAIEQTLARVNHKIGHAPTR